MATLTRAHQELFRRTPDECFPSFDSLYKKCADDHIASDDLWSRPQDVEISHDLTLRIDGSSAFNLTDWSFSQLCRMAGVSRDTINRLSAKTASLAFAETLPHSDKPLQLLTTGEHIRSIHGASYTRLWNVELLDMIKEYAFYFQPPQVAMDGSSTGRVVNRSGVVPQASVHSNADHIYFAAFSFVPNGTDAMIIPIPSLERLGYSLPSLPGLKDLCDRAKGEGTFLSRFVDPIVRDDS